VVSILRRVAWPALVLAILVWIAQDAWAGQALTLNSFGSTVMFALPLAGIYALNATGLVVVYSSTGIFNLAQGSIGMVGAYVYWTLSVQWKLPVLLSLFLTICVFAPVLGVALDMVMMRRLASASVIAKLSGTLGLSLTLLGLASLIWSQNVPHTIAPLGGSGGVHLFGVLLTWHRFITIAAALGIALLLRWVLRGTRLGISMRAIVDNADLAALYGIRHARVSSLAWVLGSCTATVASILIAPDLGNFSAQTLSLLIIDSFAAAAFGRLRSLAMTYAGAMVLGLTVSFSTTFLRFGGRWTLVPAAIPAIALFVVLLFLPETAPSLGRALRTYRIESVPSWRSALVTSAILIAGVSLGVPLLSTGSVVRLTVGIATGIILLGLVPLVGWAGLPFLAPYALAGFGAWVTWRLHGDLPDLMCVLVGGCVASAVGIAAAFPALRLRGLYLALGSIAFAQVAVTVIFPLPGLLESDHQVARPTLLGINLHGSTSFIGFATVAYVVMALGLVWLRRSRIGRRLIATRDSEAAAASVGISLIQTKIVVFAVAGLIAGVGGGVLVEGQQFVSVSQLSLIAGLSLVLSLTVFGIGTVSGPVLAGLSSAVIAVVSATYLTGAWGDALTVAGPGLAALSLISFPRGSVPEVIADFKTHPSFVLARVAGLALGASIGVFGHLPGFVGCSFAVAGAIAGGAVLEIATARRRGHLDALGAEGRGPLDIDAPTLGVNRGMDEVIRTRLDAALGIVGTRS
jgi:branched-chain amino acid transport system permease protein